MEANHRNGASSILPIFYMSVCVLLPGGLTLELDFFTEISGYLAAPVYPKNACLMQDKLYYC